MSTTLIPLMPPPAQISDPLNPLTWQFRRVLNPSCLQSGFANKPGSDILSVFLPIVSFFSSTCAEFPPRRHSFGPTCSGTRRMGTTRTSPSASVSLRTVTSWFGPSNAFMPHSSVISTSFSPSPSVQDLTLTSLIRDPTGLMKRNRVVKINYPRSTFIRRNSSHFCLSPIHKCWILL